MSEIHGIFSAIGVPVAETIAQHRARPPHEKTFLALGFTASLSAWCVYLAPMFAGPAMRARASHDEWVTAGMWAAVLAVALLGLIAAWRGARGMRDWWAAFWRLALAGVCAALLWYRVYPDGAGDLVAFLLKGFYWGWLAAHLARFFAAAQLFAGGSAFRVVSTAIDDSEFQWDGPPRCWWRFWRR